MSANKLWVERTGERTYVGRSSSGATVQIGSGPGKFAPGELLKLAVAGCSALSCDQRFINALGTSDFKLNALVETEYDEESDRFNSFLVQLVADLSKLSEEEQIKLSERSLAAIDRLCTVGHTLKQDPHPSINITIHNEPENK